MAEEYDLADIDYEKWDYAFDDYNSARRELPDLQFESWYHQQKHVVNQASQIQEEIDDEDNEVYHISSNLLAELFYNLHKKACELRDDEYNDDEDEWDPWDEDAENDEEDNHLPF